MPRKNRGMRPLIYILTLALAPILLVTQPYVATAATVAGPSVGGSFDYSMSAIPGSDGKCNLTGNWDRSGTTPGVSVELACSRGWNFGPERVDLQWSGTDATGQYCEATHAYDFDWSGYSTRTARTIAAISTDGDVNTCRMSEVCWQLYADENSWRDQKDDEGCLPMDLGDMGPEEPSGVCPLFTVGDGSPLTRPRFENSDPYVKYEGGPSWWDYNIIKAITYAMGEVQNPGGPQLFRRLATDKIELGVIYQDERQPNPGRLWYGMPANGSNVGVVTDPQLDGEWHRPMGDVGTRGAEAIYSYNWGNRSDYNIIGFQLSYRGSIAPDTETAFKPYLPQDRDNGTLGVTDPGRCLFYWGKKIAELPNSDKDEPYLGEFDPELPPSGPDGPAAPDDPPTPDEGGCDGFSVTDPSSWTGAAACMLVKLIARLIEVVGSVLNAILGLPAKIATAFRNMLEALFVPSPGALDDAKSKLSGTLSESSYQEWKDSATGLFPQASSAAPLAQPLSSGCKGPSLTWDYFAKVGLPTTIHPVEACSGTMAQAAAWCRILLTVLIGGSALIKILQMITVSLGMSKQINALSFDWGNDVTSRKY